MPKLFEMNFSSFTTFMEGTIYLFNDMEIPKFFFPNEPYIVRASLYRQKKNMNSFILIVGGVRTGKSYTGIKVAQRIEMLNGKVFDVQKQLTFDDVKKFLLWSRNAEGSVFVLDETGTSLSPELFWSLQQRIMRRFAQTQGFRKNILIWILPSIVFIQKGFRFLTNYAIKTRNQGLVEVYKIVIDQLQGKGFPDRIERMRVDMLDPETIEKYEAMKKEWNDQDLQSEINFLDDLNKPTEINFPYGDYIDLFKNGMIDEVELESRLKKMSFNAEDARLIVVSELNKKNNSKPNQPKKAESLSDEQRRSLELGISLAK